ncbi:non-symbiotic hemoglobin 1-like [Centruroides sculpturatus]|uniref:non-symbiotic hemoglobin 1-like n=1 Tax=Centruroides sculpturatus TaxID=218467 RepID=UPI000C6C8E7A|nr:non-symbiotic hemoglobin 1-like [Centruroides sculpturatus]
MGCVPAKSVSNLPYGLGGFKGGVPFVTYQQKVALVQTWNVLMENLSRVGVIAFMRLFETHPDVQEIFIPFKGLDHESLRNSKELRAHALRVMSFVQKVVARLEQPRKLEMLLGELGKSHLNYGAKAEYIEKIGPQFIYAVKPMLEDHWNPGVENAWLQLFRYITHYMKVTMERSDKETVDDDNRKKNKMKIMRHSFRGKLYK